MCVLPAILEESVKYRVDTAYLKGQVMQVCTKILVSSERICAHATSSSFSCIHGI